MLIIGTDDPEGLEEMADMAGEALGAEYPLVGVPMVLEDGKWLDWMPPPGHKPRRRSREMKLRWIGSDYAEQMKPLDAPHEKTGDDAFVANFSAVEKDDECGLVSYCVRGEGVRTLLPETDRSVLMRECGDGPGGDRRPAARGRADGPPAGRYLGLPVAIPDARMTRRRGDRGARNGGTGGGPGPSSVGNRSPSNKREESTPWDITPSFSGFRTAFHDWVTHNPVCRNQPTISSAVTSRNPSPMASYTDQRNYPRLSR
jgi:hypothetical protein